MRQNLSLELAQARRFGQSEHVSSVSIIRNKTAKA
jgi:hypothetical protein